MLADDSIIRRYLGSNLSPVLLTKTTLLVLLDEKTRGDVQSKSSIRSRCVSFNYNDLELLDQHSDLIKFPDSLPAFGNYLDHTEPAV